MASIFRTKATLRRLDAAVPTEINDEWQTEKRYLTKRSPLPVRGPEMGLEKGSCPFDGSLFQQTCRAGNVARSASDEVQIAAPNVGCFHLPVG